MSALLALLWSCGGSEFTAHNSQDLPDASSGGNQGQGGAGASLGRGGGAGRGGSASGGAAGEGGTSGDAGSGGSGTGGDSGTGPDASGGENGSAGDAGVIGVDAAADATCTPVLFYPDLDHDGFGTEAGATLMCAAPSQSWARRAGDCDDSNAAVNPDAGFGGEGYDAKNGLSFDYNCDGTEEPDTSQYPAAPNCTGFNLGNCRGAGFAPTSRSGPGVNSLCGSTTYVECKADLLVCGAAISQVPPKRCR